MVGGQIPDAKVPGRLGSKQLGQPPRPDHPHTSSLQLLSAVQSKRESPFKRHFEEGAGWGEKNHRNHRMPTSSAQRPQAWSPASESESLLSGISPMAIKIKSNSSV